MKLKSIPRRDATVGSCWAIFENQVAAINDDMENIQEPILPLINVDTN